MHNTSTMERIATASYSLQASAYLQSAEARLSAGAGSNDTRKQKRAWRSIIQRAFVSIRFVCSPLPRYIFASSDLILLFASFLVSNQKK